jgi:hypothetical protein
MFDALDSFGFPKEFIGITKMLFLDAEASVKVNGSPSSSFQFRRGVRQGCPLAPYLFLIVAEVLNAMVKIEVHEGIVKGIALPVENRQQVIL